METSPAPYEGMFGRFARRLGEGATKTVYEGLDLNHGKLVAWNEVTISDADHISSSQRQQIQAEVELLRTVQHPNIIDFYGGWATRDKVIFITEIVESGDLQRFYRTHRVKLKIIKKWSRQILSALNYLHSHDPPIIHRDVKCENILYNAAEGTVKMGDLGLSTSVSEAGSVGSAAAGLCGTPAYIAPEQYDGRCTYEVDIYAFGMCVLEMVTGRIPYDECNNAAQIFKRVITGVMPESYASIRYPSIQAFIQFCIQPGPSGSRPSAAEVLAHSFLDESYHAPEDDTDALLKGADHARDSSAHGDGSGAAAIPDTVSSSSTSREHDLSPRDECPSAVSLATSEPATSDLNAFVTAHHAHHRRPGTTATSATSEGSSEAELAQGWEAPVPAQRTDDHDDVASAASSATGISYNDYATANQHDGRAAGDAASRPQPSSPVLIGIRSQRHAGTPHAGTYLAAARRGLDQQPQDELSDTGGGSMPRYISSSLEADGNEFRLGGELDGGGSMSEGGGGRPAFSDFDARSSSEFGRGESPFIASDTGYEGTSTRPGSAHSAAFGDDTADAASDSAYNDGDDGGGFVASGDANHHNDPSSVSDADGGVGAQDQQAYDDEEGDDEDGAGSQRGRGYTGNGRSDSFASGATLEADNFGQPVASDRLAGVRYRTGQDFGLLQHENNEENDVTGLVDIDPDAVSDGGVSPAAASYSNDGAYQSNIHDNQAQHDDDTSDVETRSGVSGASSVPGRLHDHDGLRLQGEPEVDGVFYAADGRPGMLNQISLQSMEMYSRSAGEQRQQFAHEHDGGGGSILLNGTGTPGSLFSPLGGGLGTSVDRLPDGLSQDFSGSGEINGEFASSMNGLDGGLADYNRDYNLGGTGSSADFAALNLQQGVSNASTNGFDSTGMSGDFARMGSSSGRLDDTFDAAPDGDGFPDAGRISPSRPSDVGGHIDRIDSQGDLGGGVAQDEDATADAVLSEHADGQERSALPFRVSTLDRQQQLQPGTSSEFVSHSAGSSLNEMPWGRFGSHAGSAVGSASGSRRASVDRFQTPHEHGGSTASFPRPASGLLEGGANFDDTPATPRTHDNSLIHTRNATPVGEQQHDHAVVASNDDDRNEIGLSARDSSGAPRSPEDGSAASNLDLLGHVASASPAAALSGSSAPQQLLSPSYLDPAASIADDGVDGADRSPIQSEGVLMTPTAAPPLSPLMGGTPMSTGAPSLRSSLRYGRDGGASASSIGHLLIRGYGASDPATGTSGSGFDAATAGVDTGAGLSHATQDFDAPQDGDRVQLELVLEQDSTNSEGQTVVNRASIKFDFDKQRADSTATARELISYLGSIQSLQVDERLVPCLASFLDTQRHDLRVSVNGASNGFRMMLN